jgi:glycosyltransferase involved in cell wall biosynthesis
VKIAMLSFRLPLAGPQKRGLKRGGVERVAHDLAQGLALRGHQVTVFSADPAPPGSAYRVRPMPGAPLIHHWLGFRLVSGYLGNLLALFPRYSDAQAIIAHGDSLLLPLRGIPVLRIMHGSALDEALTARSPARALLQFGVFLQEWLTASTQNTVAISRNTQKRYPAICEVIPNGVDQKLFFADDQPKAAKPTILFVGTLGGRKRGRLLLDAFMNIIRPSLPGAQLWMVGEPGPPAEGVHYYSNLSTEALAEQYRRAWVFASPSSYEGFGLPYLEAMASGTAVVASSNPGSRELLDGGRYGSLVEHDADFPAAVLEMLRDEELRERYVACGLERARQFSLARMLDQYERLLAPQAASPLSLGASA